jgi:hypothetical protein
MFSEGQLSDIALVGRSRRGGRRGDPQRMSLKVVRLKESTHDRLRRLKADIGAKTDDEAIWYLLQQGTRTQEHDR